MKKRTFIIDQVLYEVIIQSQLKLFTVKELRDLYANRLKSECVGPISLAKVRIYVYEYLRRMVKAGWVKLGEERRTRDQIYYLNDFPGHLIMQFTPETLASRLGIGASPMQATVKPKEISSHLLLLRSQLKELELDMFAALGEVERYKILIQDMPEFSIRLQQPYQSAREHSSKLIGHFRAVENALSLLQTE